MKLKLDENLPNSLRGILTAMNHDVETVLSEGLKGKSDKDVWQAAQKEGRFFITQDLDFSDIRHYKPGEHYGLLILRLSNPSRKELTRKIAGIFKLEDVESWKKCFVIITDNKIRIKRPDSEKF